MSKPTYLQFLKDTGKVITTNEGQSVPVWELSVPDGDPCLTEWAARFRQHYCPDVEIDEMRDGTGLSRAEYLINFCFPDSSVAPGPSVRAGDFAELLISDFVEHLLGYWVPRGKYGEKESRNESANGVDILGFKVVAANKPSVQDELLTFEVKAQFTDREYQGRLQTAINDSEKDFVRSGISLNASKRRFVKDKDQDKINLISRFQNIADHPFILRSGAAAMLSGKAYDETKLKGTTTAGHTNRSNLQMIVIKGQSLMSLTHALYQRAADEA